MILINLLPVRVSRRALAGRQQLALMSLVIVLVLIGNVAWNQSRAVDLSRRERKLRQTRDSIGQIERVIGEVNAIRAQQATIKDKLATLETLKAARQGPVRVLDDLASLIPAKLWLRKLDEKGGLVTFDGTGASIDEVSAFLTALKKSRYFGAPELRKTSARSEAGLKLVEFTITATVNYTPTLQAVSVVAALPEKR